MKGEVQSSIVLWLDIKSASIVLSYTPILNIDNFAVRVCFWGQLVLVAHSSLLKHISDTACKRNSCAPTNIKIQGM